ncbi:RNA-binding, Nab2-type zinc finger domain containing protein [Nitzschia inconspicua]|uniref:RNA-binding, Nab2-type zinc finger domain containing protein n=1 Tax=Nitzschia inconspicua TaxID=303405 RepID=A0A9K3P871_9STRA|nr:RNA-binding, Nab2-type zinc finger domain containing protein [Nitzschia inconspicua]KAG7358853.1 RNA-binding, Nab2-type zinc finger domain containing protein [Nitzschia inconspicua]
MARGKNYVNNDRGVHLAAAQKGPSGVGKGKKNNQIMQLCEYGPGCTRPDCIYRHEEPTTNAASGGNDSKNNRDAVCVLFLAGKCSFKDKGCRKRHPSKEEVARLIVRYKKIRCRFGDECYTDSCLFLHPRDTKDQDPVAFIEPHHFPPLHNGSHSGYGGGGGVKPIPNSAWNSAPIGVQGKNVAAPIAFPTNGVGLPPHPPSTQEATTPGNQDSIPRPPPPSPNLHHQQEQQQMPPHGAWVYPPNHGEMPPANMMIPPPPQQYYGGGLMHPPQPLIDPNTGYPIDPAFYEKQQQQYQAAMMYAAHPGMPYYGIPMGIPLETTHFNVEAKEFVPQGSA